jgi:hypothetical protein
MLRRSSEPLPIPLKELLVLGLALAVGAWALLSLLFDALSGNQWAIIVVMIFAIWWFTDWFSD